MQTEENKRIVRRIIEEAQNSGNLATVDELVAEDFVNHTPFGDLPRNREGVKLIFSAMRGAFPDLHAEIHLQLAEGSDVMTRKTFRGTHLGELFGAPPTGRSIAFDVIDILRLRDGLVTDHWAVIDMFGLMQQIGAGAQAESSPA